MAEESRRRDDIDVGHAKPAWMRCCFSPRRGGRTRTSPAWPCGHDTDGDSVADTSDNCPKDASADEADDGGDGTGEECDDDGGGGGTPGFELVALVAALGAALVLVRRRS